MAARKLQTEIERTLKKVSEGVEVFEGIYEKMQGSTNMAQKEKQEADLKTQIKKLQRMRDQIKTWVASNEIKDKTQLVENRKLIETQMERFKACEKEMKTKAFSKEGLIAAQRLDPKEREKLETSNWLSSMVDELSRQVEATEAEVETLQGGAKKKGKPGPSQGRLESLEALNERRKWHIGRLEIILRLLENGTLPAEDVTILKEDISYFVESNTEEDFTEDDAIYDKLNLDEEEESWRVGGEDLGTENDSLSGADDLPPRTPLKILKSPTTEEDPTINRKEELSSPVLKKVVPVRKNTLDLPKPPPIPTPNFAQQPMASALKAGLPQPPRPPAGPLPVRYATAAAAAVNINTTPAPSNPTQTTSPSTITPSAPVPPPLRSQTPPLPQPTLAAVSPTISSPMVSVRSSSQHRKDSSSSLDQAPGSAGALSMSPDPPAQPAQQPSPRREESGASQPTSTNGTNGAHASTSQLSLAPQPPVPIIAPIQPVGQSRRNHTSYTPVDDLAPGAHLSGQTLSTNPLSESSARLPNSLSDLVTAFETAKQKASHRMNNLDQVHKVLEVGMNNVPQPQDAEKPKYYVPRNLYITPPYYPQVPTAVLSSPHIFASLDVETLFYVFYYLPGSYQQYLAARELKKQSWRFHVKYLTWFQRHSEPQAITDEYEQGVYVYFDWEGSWCQRKKSDFRFEYRYLSED